MNFIYAELMHPGIVYSFIRFGETLYSDGHWTLLEENIYKWEFMASFFISEIKKLSTKKHSLLLWLWETKAI